MATRIARPETETLETLAHRLEGLSNELAVALHRGLDWPLMAVYDHAPSSGGSIIHIGVLFPGVWFFDIRGKVTFTQLEQEFGEDISIEQLEGGEPELRRHIGPILENNIIKAGRLAMLRWPHLPWKPDTLLSSMAAFLKDLEALSRRHGFWIAGKADSLGWTWPTIAIDEGGEDGYELATTDQGFCFNRVRK